MSPPLLMQWRTDAADIEPGHVEVRRLDRGVLREPQRTPQGFIWAEGVGACAGVYPYWIVGADGKPKKVLELIDDDTLRQDAADIGRLPMGYPHPPKTDNNPGGEITADNAEELLVGDVGERVHYEEDAHGGYVKLSVTLRRRDAVDAFESGKATELSFGYRAIVDPTPGVHPRYGRYDQRQIRRVYNHLALVPRGRHGPEASLRADALDDETSAQIVASLAGLGVGGAVQLTPPRRLDAEPRSTPKDDSTPPRIDPMEWALIAMSLGLRTDGSDDEQVKQLVVRRLNKLKSDADNHEKALADARRDAAEEARADMSGKMKGVIDMMKKHLKGVDGYAEDMEPEALADMFSKEFEKYKGKAASAKKDADRLQAAEDKRRADARRAELDGLVQQQRLKVDGATIKADGVDSSGIETIGAYEKAIAAAVLGDRFDAEGSEVYFTTVVDLELAKTDKGGSRGDAYGDRQRYTPNTKPKADNKGEETSFRSDDPDTWVHPSQKNADKYRAKEGVFA